MSARYPPPAQAVVTRFGGVGEPAGGGRWVEGRRGDGCRAEQSSGGRRRVKGAGPRSRWRRHTPRHAAAACSQVSRPAASSTSSRRPARRSSSPAYTARRRLSITWGCRAAESGVAKVTVGGRPAPAAPHARNLRRQPPALLHRQPPLCVPGVLRRLQPVRALLPALRHVWNLRSPRAFLPAAPVCSLVRPTCAHLHPPTTCIRILPSRTKGSDARDMWGAPSLQMSRGQSTVGSGGQLRHQNT